MTKLKPNQFKQDKFCQSVRKRYKKRFKKAMPYKDSEVMKVINEWLEETVEAVSQGKKVKLSKDSYMQVIGTKILEHKTYREVVGKGNYLTSNGMKKANNMNSKRNDAVYAITYVNPSSKEKIYFTAHPSFRKKVSDALRTNNNYYHVK